MATVALRWSGSASPTLPPSRPAFDGIKRMLLLRPPQRPGSRHDLVPAPDAAAAAGVRHVVWVHPLLRRYSPPKYFATEQPLVAYPEE
jgi:hypothetical protein